MCMFSEPIEIVNDTSVFARVEGAHQYLAYSMSFGAASDLAMILPIPTVPNSGDEAVSFLDFSHCPFFFETLRQYFPVEMVVSFGVAELGAAAPPEPPLVVHEVGAFEASYVPNIASFRRLDARFRFSDAIWSQLPQYQDYGFAVFKLKAGRNRRIHPMAFRFPTRDRSKLFFPTLHIHDGTVADQAYFDHALYCQDRPQDASSWEPSSGPIEVSPDPEPAPGLSQESTKGVVVFGEPAWKLGIVGPRPNQDVWVPLA